jgi:sirohydrochlorin ferrochelatase
MSGTGRPAPPSPAVVAAIAAAVRECLGHDRFRLTEVRPAAPAWGSGEAWRLTARQAGLREEGMRR